MRHDDADLSDPELGRSCLVGCGCILAALVIFGALGFWATGLL